jgi:PIN domain nuclease of toxin-antitoxin system
VADPDLVADASAVLALLQGGAFRALAPERLVGAWISAVNLSEVLARLQASGLAEDEADRATAALDFRVVPFDEGHARAAARLWPLAKRAGLSLGDRACLALGAALGAPVVTADRAWAELDIGVKVVLIR